MQNQFTTLSAILEVIWARRHELGLGDTSLACTAIETSSACEDVDVPMCSIEDALCDAHECIPSDIEECAYSCVDSSVESRPYDEDCAFDVVPPECIESDANPANSRIRLSDVLDVFELLRAEIESAFDNAEKRLWFLSD